MVEGIQPYRATDENAVVGVWHWAGLAEYTYLPTWQAFTLEEVYRVFNEVILPKHELWVAVSNGVER